MTAEYFAMRVLQLEPDVYVTGQIFERDLETASKQGIRTVINNRPDDESLGQPASSDLQRAAEELGIRFVHFPVVSGRITEADIEAFSKLRDELERPMLVFCRSGARSTQLWEFCDAMQAP
jgi:sulfide:quinone oxidoreductase